MRDVPLEPGAEAHLVSVARAIEHIRSGDVFQVNVCTRLEAGFSGDPLELFCPAPIVSRRVTALSSVAPLVRGRELLARAVPEAPGRKVLSSPIKGTAQA